MIQIQLISSVVELVRKLAYAEERQANRRFDPYVNYLAAPHILQKERNQKGENATPADFINALNSNL